MEMFIFVLIAAIAGWVIYRKKTGKPVVPNIGGSKGGTRLK